MITVNISLTEDLAEVLKDLDRPIEESLSSSAAGPVAGAQGRAAVPCGDRRQRQARRHRHPRQRHLPHDEAPPEDASLPARLSPHAFRVAVITDLLEQGVSLEEVQHLAGHADPRTTRIYDHRQRKITRNIVERISI